MKRWKSAIEKDMLAKGLKSSDAQDRAVCRLGCKNQPTSACRKTSRVSGKQSLLSTLLEQMDDGDDEYTAVIFKNLTKMLLIKI